MKNGAKLALRLFLKFFRISCFTFGGGWSIVAQMQKEFVEKDKLLSGEELVNLSCLGRSLPGTMIGNVAFLFGHRVGGWLCGISCLLGMISAPFIVLAVITFFYTSLLNQPVFLSAMSGVRAAVIPIIMSAALTMKKDAFLRRYCYLVALGGFVLYFFFDISCVALVLGAATIGLAESVIAKRSGRNGAS